MSDRMPPIPADQQTPAQQAVSREMAAGRRGAVVGPFVATLRSPEFTRRLQALGEYLRYDHALEPRLREMVILLTARDWTQEFEWATHVQTALDSGLSREVIDAIADLRRPRRMREDEAVLYDFFHELRRDRAVSDATYASAVAAFTERGVVDLVGAVGYYSTLAMIMSVARTPLPAGYTPRLKPLPESRDDGRR